MLDMDTIVFLAELLASYLAVTASVVGLLVLLSIKLHPRPLAGSLIASIAGGALLAVCNPLIILSGPNLAGIILWGDFSTLHTLLDVPYYWYIFQFLGIPAAIFGAIVGLMAHASTFLWRGAKRSRSRTVLGLLLLLLTWLVLGLGSTVEFLFLGAVSR